MTDSATRSGNESKNHDELTEEFSRELFQLAQEYHDKGLSTTTLRVVAKETIKEVGGLTGFNSNRTQEER